MSDLNSRARGRCIVIELEGDSATLANAMRAFAAAVTGAALPVVDVLALAPTPAPRAIAGRTPNKRAAAIAPGGIPDRILSILREADAPVMKKDLETQAKTSRYFLDLAMTDLLADGRVVALGKTSQRRYATPEIARKEQGKR